jgi:hypothetical protein
LGDDADVVATIACGAIGDGVHLVGRGVAGNVAPCLEGDVDDRMARHAAGSAGACTTRCGMAASPVSRHSMQKRVLCKWLNGNENRAFISVLARDENIISS